MKMEKLCIREVRKLFTETQNKALFGFDKYLICVINFFKPMMWIVESPEIAYLGISFTEVDENVDLIKCKKDRIEVLQALANLYYFISIYLYVRKEKNTTFVDSESLPNLFINAYILWLL